MIDFDKLSRPKSAAKPLDPIEIFAKTPNLKDAPNDLWKGQADALAQWHIERAHPDNLVILNTGAGKSIVGILIAQSLVNEGIGPIVYACSTIDLVSQTARECDRLGVTYTVRAQSKFNNDRFETGQAFCITTYQALFSPISAFTKDRTPSAIIFDDAHVAERLIRDAFTLVIDKSEHPTLFDRIVDIVRPEFERIDKGAHLAFVLEDVGQQQVTMCPPGTAGRSSQQILESLKAADYRNQPDLMFPTVQLFEHLQHCAILVSPSRIEIAPPFIPTGRFAFLGDGTRRVYLSATLDYETDFVRAFGKKNLRRIEPDNDAGNGERLILLAAPFPPISDKLSVAKAILSSQKLLVAVPSYARAKEWITVATPPQPNEFSRRLDEFRLARTGSFVLVSRIDGIDLPQDTCRVMIVDGSPSGATLLEQYLISHLSLNNMFAAKMASRITQLMGRINRGRSDYGAFVLFGRDLNVWMQTERNVALLPILLRKQFILGQTLQQSFPRSDPPEIAGVINQVISRDPGWLKFYRDTIDGLEVSDEAIVRVKEREAQLAKCAAAESSFMTRLWQSDIEGARRALLDVLDDTALADARLAGWYSVWLGMTYESAGDVNTALAHYRRARSRLSSWLNVPVKDEIDPSTTAGSGTKTPMQVALLAVTRHGPQAVGDLVSKLKANRNRLGDDSLTFKQHEEAVRMFGELIGYAAGRPDNETSSGPDVTWIDESTLHGVAFELKTKKQSPAIYNKGEIGQSHNHIQWLADNHPDVSYSGLLIVGPAGSCTSDSSPSDDLFFCDRAALLDRMGMLIAAIDDTRGKTELERWQMLYELGGLPEWGVDGWFGALATRNMKSLQ